MGKRDICVPDLFIYFDVKKAAKMIRNYNVWLTQRYTGITHDPLEQGIF
jgi:hypothetical protein